MSHSSAGIDSGGKKPWAPDSVHPHPCIYQRTSEPMRRQDATSSEPYLPPSRAVSLRRARFLFGRVPSRRVPTRGGFERAASRILRTNAGHIDHIYTSCQQLFCLIVLLFLLLLLLLLSPAPAWRAQRYLLLSEVSGPISPTRYSRHHPTWRSVSLFFRGQTTLHCSTTVIALPLGTRHLNSDIKVQDALEDKNRGCCHHR